MSQRASAQLHAGRCRAALPAALALSGLLAACCPCLPAPAPAGAAASASALTQELPMLSAPPLWMSPDHVRAACAEHLGQARALRAALRAGAPPTEAGTLVPYNRMLIALDRVLPTSDLIANVHPDKAVREAAEACQQEAMQLVTEIGLDRGLHDALAAVPTADLDLAAQRFVRLLLRDFRRSGVDRDEATRQRIAAIKAELVKVGQDFSRAIREDKRSVSLPTTALAGLPPDYLAAHQPGADGQVAISTDYPDFFPFMTYAHDGAARRALLVQYLDRAWPANDAALARLLALRHELATALGYADWAAYNAEDKMVKSAEAIETFIGRVADLARPRMAADLADLLARKRRDDPAAAAVMEWDRFYYIQRVQSERFDLDPQEVRAHFPVAQVTAGLLDLSQRLFGLRFARVADAPVWHPDVQAYDVLQDGQPLARFYLDLHPREGKYGHAAEFGILTGVPGVQLPSAALVTNFPDPAKGPALMEHSEVTTFFHEFGHLLHQLLSGRHRWVTQSGISCEWDFVEAPSQLLEEWAWDPQVLAGFARHHQTGAPIPADLVRRMRQADEFGKGVTVMRQMFYAALSLAYHRGDPAGRDLLATYRELQGRYSPYPYSEGTHGYANFGHLEGYSSMYYTYMWSLVLAKDLFTRFAAAGLLDTATAADYRAAILEAGGTADAAELVERFLGRPSSFAAYEAWLSRE